MKMKRVIGINLDFLIQYRELDGLEMLLRMFFSMLIGGLIGVERESKNRPAGLRTHVLVCLGAAAVALTECLLPSGVLALPDGSGISFTLGRMSAQVISGIGFLGAGTIFVAQRKISGLTTAASLWNVACLGLLIGFGFYWTCLLLCAAVLSVLAFLQKVIKVNALKYLEIRFVSRHETLAFVDSYFKQNGIKVLDVDFRAESLGEGGPDQQNEYTNIYTLHLPSSVLFSDVVISLSDYPDISLVRTRNL